jgi:undecaprenyl-diphosphatase
MDKKLLFLINREWTSPTLDKLMALASSVSFWAVPLALAALWLAWKGGFRGRVFVVLALLAFGVTDGIVGRNLKHAVARLRPHQTEFGVRIIELARPAWKGAISPVTEKLSLGNADVKKAEGRSFPSNHSANTAAVALVAALLFRRGWTVFLPALVVSYSRVYTGAHWPSDVCAGILIGIGVGLVVFVVSEWAWRRYGERIAPGVIARHPSLLTE